MSGLDLPRAIQLGTKIVQQHELIEEIKKVLRFGRGFDGLAVEIEAISLKLHERLQNGPVLIRIHEVNDFINNGFFTQFMQEFWEPLAKRLEALKSAQSNQSYHKLVLILIEEKQCFQEDHQQLINHLPDKADHSKILLLPEIPAIDLAEFNRWLEMDYNADESLFMTEFGAWDEAKKSAWLGEKRSDAARSIYGKNLQRI